MPGYSFLYIIKCREECVNVRETFCHRYSMPFIFDCRVQDITAKSSVLPRHLGAWKSFLNPRRRSVPVQDMTCLI